MRPFVNEYRPLGIFTTGTTCNTKTYVMRYTGRRQKRGNIKDNRRAIKRVSIEERPKVVAQRKRIGNIEVDLMMGS